MTILKMCCGKCHHSSYTKGFYTPPTFPILTTMNDETLAPGPLDEFCKEALKRFKIGSKGLQVVFQKGPHGPEFKFRPAHYDFRKDIIVLHHDLINEAMKVQKVPSEPLLRYLMYFGVGMSAEARRMASSGVCPLLNFVEPDLRRRWYKMHWTRLEEDSSRLSDQVIEFTVDQYLHTINIGNPIPATGHNAHLRALRKQDVSKFQEDMCKDVLGYVSRALFSLDAVPNANLERDSLEKFARTATGPKLWFYINRAVKKLEFGRPESYREGYPAVAEALFPELQVIPKDAHITSLPEEWDMPKVWKTENCTYFDWKLRTERPPDQNGK